MKIYTRSGDKGSTQIYADEVVRMQKSADVLECYGTLDELNAHVGFLVSLLPGSENLLYLQEIQQKLFQIGFAISATTTLDAQDVSSVEEQIDRLQSLLPAQTSFILPGGCQEAAQAHVCRTVARRAERRMVALTEEHAVPDACLSYLNRLSDYFFVLARHLNLLADVEETRTT